MGSNGMSGGSFSISGSPTVEGKGARYDLSNPKGVPSVSLKNAVQLARCGTAFEATDEYKERTAAGEGEPCAQAAVVPDGVPVRQPGAHGGHQPVPLPVQDHDDVDVQRAAGHARPPCAMS